jgi:hypothetical protein
LGALVSFWADGALMLLACLMTRLSAHLLV